MIAHGAAFPGTAIRRQSVSVGLVPLYRWGAGGYESSVPTKLSARLGSQGHDQPLAAGLFFFLACVRVYARGWILVGISDRVHVHGDPDFQRGLLLGRHIGQSHLTAHTDMKMQTETAHFGLQVIIAVINLIASDFLDPLCKRVFAFFTVHLCQP